MSHPAVDGDGRWCAYAERDGRTWLVGGSGSGELRVLASLAVGPLGPTMNEAGRIAFRATDGDGVPGIWTWANGAATPVVVIGPRFRAFHGLPVVDGKGAIVFRADLTDGTAVVARAWAGQVDVLHRAGTMNAFPCVNAAGDVVFVADGALRLAMQGGVAQLPSPRAFAHVRGALVDGARRVIALATPRDGTLGIYGPDGTRIVGLHDPFEDDIVTDFALNPVSISASGQLAIRLTLARSGERIVRAAV